MVAFVCLFFPVYLANSFQEVMFPKAQLFYSNANQLEFVQHPPTVTHTDEHLPKAGC